MTANQFYDQLLDEIAVSPKNMNDARTSATRSAQRSSASSARTSATVSGSFRSARSRRARRSGRRDPRRRRCRRGARRARALGVEPAGGDAGPPPAGSSRCSPAVTS